MKITEYVPWRGIWMFPIWVGAFLLGLLLIAPGTVPPEMERWTPPSLAVYLLGAAFVTFCKELHHTRFRYQVRKGLKEDPYAGEPASSGAGGGLLPGKWIAVYGAFHFLLLASLVIYNWGKGVL